MRTAGASEEQRGKQKRMLWQPNPSLEGVIVCVVRRSFILASDILKKFRFQNAIFVFDKK
jgi:hypothetical protein